MAMTHPRLDELLKLPVQERAKLAQALLASLDDGVADDDGAADKDVESAWTDELARRLKSLDDGTAELIDGANARRRVRECLRTIRAAR